MSDQPGGIQSRSPIEKVRAELARYEHSLMVFSACEKDDGTLLLVIELKNPPPDTHTYEAELHPRDIMSGQFQWAFQRLLYDCVHDYMVELFIRNPQSENGLS